MCQVVLTSTLVIVGEQRLEGGFVVARSVVRCWCGGCGGPGTGDRRTGRGALTWRMPEGCTAYEEELLEDLLSDLGS